VDGVINRKWTDSELVERAQAGDRKAYSTLVERHMSRLYRLARRMNLSPEDAADAIQETFLAAYRALPRFDFSYQFSTWITRILLNRISKVHRGLRRMRRILISREMSPAEVDALEQVRPATPHELLEQSELHDHLERAIQKLPAPQRMVFILFEMEGYKIHEIAKILDIPEGTVTSRLHHARKFLRKILHENL